jgi:hypothetical protein
MSAARRNTSRHAALICRIASIALALAACSAHAQFQFAPQITAVAPGQHSQEITISLLPPPNTAGAQISMAMNLDRFGWVQALPSSTQAGMSKRCIVVGGVVHAEVVSGTTFDTMYAIPVCRVRVRPHQATPLGNYYLSYLNGFLMRTDGSSQSASANTVRVIVDD